MSTPPRDPIRPPPQPTSLSSSTATIRPRSDSGSGSHTHAHTYAGASTPPSIAHAPSSSSATSYASGGRTTTPPSAARSHTRTSSSPHDRNAPLPPLPPLPFPSAADDASASPLSSSPAHAKPNPNAYAYLPSTSISPPSQSGSPTALAFPPSSSSSPGSSTHHLPASASGVTRRRGRSTPPAPGAGPGHASLSPSRNASPSPLSRAPASSSAGGYSPSNLGLGLGLSNTSPSAHTPPSPSPDVDNAGPSTQDPEALTSTFLTRTHDANANLLSSVTPLARSRSRTRSRSGSGSRSSSADPDARSVHTARRRRGGSLSAHGHGGGAGRGEDDGYTSDREEHPRAHSDIGYEPAGSPGVIARHEAGSASASGWWGTLEGVGGRMPRPWRNSSQSIHQVQQLGVSTTPSARQQQQQQVEMVQAQAQDRSLKGVGVVVRKASVPVEQVEAWRTTGEHVSRALLSILPAQTLRDALTAARPIAKDALKAARPIAKDALKIAHDVLETGVDVLEFVPLPGLESAARTLLAIWDAVQEVDMNRLGCLRLTERCADILFSVREEIRDAGDAVADELKAPIKKLESVFGDVHTFLLRQIHRPFLKRYLKRDEIVKAIAGCDSKLTGALSQFSLSIQIRTLKQIQVAQAADEAGRAETNKLLHAVLANQQAQAAGLPLPNPEVHVPVQIAGSGRVDALQITQGETGTARPRLHPDLYAAPGSAPGPPYPITTTKRRPSSRPSSAGGPVPVPTTPSDLHTASSTQILSAIRALRAAQNALDSARDAADLRQLQRAALLSGDDVQVLEMFQVGREELPEAVKTLQRALERELERERAVGVAPPGAGAGAALGDGGQAVVQPRALPLAAPEEPDMPMAPLKDKAGLGMARMGLTRGLSRRSAASTAPPGAYSYVEGSGMSASTATGGSGGTDVARDTLDREFIEGGIDAMRRLSRGRELNVPSWTITRYEVDREEKIGVGFFSDVYKGRWRGHPVAIKILAPTTPAALFRHEVAIWKTLSHRNVLKLYGASSATGETPWFFVSPYYKNGSLVTYLKTRDGGAGGSSGTGMSAGQGAAVGAAVFGAKDVVRMVHEVAVGMKYLHAQEVLHGDLKAANILIDDHAHCVIADFGQSEMKSEAFRISGKSPPHGTTRWQAPELMSGQSHLTMECDVYSFAILCVEVIMKGGLPWPSLDDDAVRSFVLRDDKRPPIPATRLVTVALISLIERCWRREPSARPPFARIASELDKQLKQLGVVEEVIPTSPRVSELWGEGAPAQKSPDMRPIPLPREPIPEEPLAGVSSSPMSAHTQASTDSYQTAFDPSSVASRQNTGIATPAYYNTVKSVTSSLFTADLSTQSESDGLDLSGYDSPVPLDPRAASARDERRYRLLLKHEFHPSLLLPLWEPASVELGAVGYLLRPEGRFVTLCNCFRPPGKLPNVYGYGKVSQGSQRQDKRNAALRGLDAISGLLPFRLKSESAVSRRYSFPLRLGHKSAYLCTETTTYRYMDSLPAPKAWFAEHIDEILRLYGVEHHLQREDIFLVIGTLSTPDYGLFVSHRNPDGQVHFNVLSSPKNGQPWGIFDTDSNVLATGPLYDEEEASASVFGTKVSQYNNGNKNDAVLIARLRFKPDATYPTSQ